MTPIQKLVREKTEEAPAKTNDRAKKDKQVKLDQVSVSDDCIAIRQLLLDISKRSSSNPNLERWSIADRPMARSIAGGDNRYMLGADFAVVAIVSLAALAKRRYDLNYTELQSLKPKPELNRTEQRNIPEWLISLDSSVAKNEGYLYQSVLSRPTIIITKSDSFVSLGERFFHDGNLGWLIVDLNLKRVKEEWLDTKRIVMVANGETIELPVWEDIVEFYLNVVSRDYARNLFTIVVNRKITRQVIQEALSAVITPGCATVDDAVPNLLRLHGEEE